MFLGSVETTLIWVCT